MRGISWLAANQLAAQVGLCTVQYVSKYLLTIDIKAFMFNSCLTISLRFLSYSSHEKACSSHVCWFLLLVLEFSTVCTFLPYKAALPINLYAPRILYIGQTYRYTTDNTFYIFSRQIYLIIFFRLSLTIFVYSSTKCLVSPNVTLLGSWNIHIVHKWCAKL